MRLNKQNAISFSLRMEREIGFTREIFADLITLFVLRKLIWLGQTMLLLSFHIDVKVVS